MHNGIEAHQYIYHMTMVVSLLCAHSVCFVDILSTVKERTVVVVVVVASRSPAHNHNFGSNT